VGNSTSCGLGTDGKAYCWGENTEGQLGNGTSADVYVPTAVTMPARVNSFSAISAGGKTTCAIAAQ